MSKKKPEFRPPSFSACRPGETVAVDWYTFQCAVAVMLDAMGIDPDELRTEDKDRALEEGTDASTKVGHQKVREIEQYFRRRIENLDPHWRKRGQPLAAVSDTELETLDLYDHWCKGDFGSNRSEGTMCFSVEAVRLFASRHGEAPPKYPEARNEWRRRMIADCNEFMKDVLGALRKENGEFKPLLAMWNDLREYANLDPDMQKYEPKLEATPRRGRKQTVLINGEKVAWRKLQELRTEMVKKEGSGAAVWEGVQENTDHTE